MCVKLLTVLGFGFLAAPYSPSPSSWLYSGLSRLTKNELQEWILEYSGFCRPLCIFIINGNAKPLQKSICLMVCGHPGVICRLSKNGSIVSALVYCTTLYYTVLYYRSGLVHWGFCRARGFAEKSPVERPCALPKPQCTNPDLKFA